MIKIILVFLLVANTTSAFTEIEIKNSATANTGGNSGEGSIQTGNASAKSTVENKINSENAASTVKAYVKAEANGEKVEKKIEKNVTDLNEDVNLSVEANSESANNNASQPPLNQAQDELPTQDPIAEKNNSQIEIISSVITGLKDFFNKILSIFS